MTKEEFFDAYCGADPQHRERMAAHFVVLPCRCDEGGCRGWAMVPNRPDMIQMHQSLYGEQEKPTTCGESNG